MKPRFFWEFVLWVVVTGAWLTAFSSCTQPSTVTRFPGITWLTHAKVNLTLDEFQRLVYSSHILTVIDAKPELEASLVALLELQRRNPEGNPTSLVKPVRRALAEYRKEASSPALPVRWRDEVLGRLDHVGLAGSGVGVRPALVRAFRGPPPPLTAHSSPLTDH